MVNFVFFFFLISFQSLVLINILEIVKKRKKINNDVIFRIVIEVTIFDMKI